MCASNPEATLMTDTATPPVQDTDGNAPQVGAAPGNPDPGASGSQVDPTPPVDPDAHDPERAARLIANLREDKRKAQEKADEQAAKLAAIEREKMSESEQQAADLKDAQERADTLQRQLDELKREVAFKDAAVEAGIRPKAVKLALAAATIETDENGQPVNLAEAIEALRGEHEYLFAPEPGDAGGQQPPATREPFVNPGAGQQPATGAEAQLTPEQLAMARRANMDPAKFLANLSPNRT